jgi:hypothetical protein
MKLGIDEITPELVGSRFFGALPFDGLTPIRFQILPEDDPGG